MSCVCNGDHGSRCITISAVVVSVSAWRGRRRDGRRGGRGAGGQALRGVCVAQTGERKVGVDAQRALLGLLLATPLGPAILEPDLDAHLGQVDLDGELLAAVHVRVVGLLEGALELVQLKGGECGAVASVLAFL